VAEVQSIINNLKCNTACGFDDIEAKFVKLHSNFFSKLLTRCINKSFVTGDFPNCLKFAVVIPVLKSGAAHDKCNYRPIALISIFSKIYETVMRNRICEFLDANNSISSRQFGFLQKSNTSVAASCLVDKIVRSLNNKNKTGALFLDIRKAFDSLDFEVLRSILLKYGISDLALKLVMSFLLGRSQVTRVDSWTPTVSNLY
jgi:hypothetical protein